MEISGLPGRRGGIGVALFFMITGFLLGKLKTDIPFGKWYLKKILRMYLPFLIFSALRFLLGILGVEAAGLEVALGNGETVTYTGIQMLRHMGARDWVSVVFPLDYWFVYMIAILYAVYFCYVKYVADKLKKANLGTGAVLLAAFLVWYGAMDKSGGEVLMNFYPIMQITWFGCMLIGRGIRKKCRAGEYDAIGSVKSGRGMMLAWIVLAAVSLLAFLTAKVCIARHIMAIQILLPVSYIGFAYGCFRLFLGLENGCRDLLTGAGAKGIAGKAVRAVSVASLEVYYVQFIWIKLLKDIMFPLNWLLLVSCITVSAYALHHAADKLSCILIPTDLY